jgi:nitric oxide reductase large subunit
MIRKLLIAACCLAVAFVAWAGWSAYQNKQRFDASWPSTPRISRPTADRGYRQA